MDALKQEMLTDPVLHADETPVAAQSRIRQNRSRLPLGLQHRCPFHPVKAVVYDLADSRAGSHARDTSSATGAARWV